MTQSGGCSEQQDVRNNYRNGRLPRPPRSPAPPPGPAPRPRAGSRRGGPEVNSRAHQRTDDVAKCFILKMTTAKYECFRRKILNRYFKEHGIA